jgi:hypothetical protein
MEARRIRAALLAAALWALLGASYRTPNFIIQTADPRLAETFGKVAEKLRHELAVSWTGKAMPDWSQPCPVTVQVAPHLGAGGATTFLFQNGEVYGWRMTIQGSAERVQDSVLPHEITHMILASHFRCPVPRWADEGAASTVEHASERAKHGQKLIEFLQTHRGIAMNRMFAMTEYPQDILPLYAQGYSLAEFLIEQGGRQRFVAYLGDGMRDNRWSAATLRHYGIPDLGALQTTWLAWVTKGSPPLRPRDDQPGPIGHGPLLASNTPLPRPEPNLIYRTATAPSPQPSPGRRGDLGQLSPEGRGYGSPASRRLVPVNWDDDNPAQAGQPLRTQLSRPQPVEQPRQTILR